MLRTDTDVTAVVTEIYRHWRRGRRVAAVISAFQGRTDQLVSLAEHVGDTGRSLGALLGVGEIESSAAVALGLERAGLPTRL
ncbi:MAG: homoserine dehydrogenase, partial [Planctomycetota bacterium]